MKKLRFTYLFIIGLVITASFFSGCMNEKGTPDYQNFPDNVGKIVFTKCATAGCHNDKSKGAAGGLSMESWDKLFEGGSGSACVIPYRSDYSTICYYTNTFSDLGVTLSPTMPYNKDALSREDVLVIKNWVDAGAPSRDGFVKFSDNLARKKFYVTNQGCDVVTVVDQATLLPMRYINVGNSSSTESPHNIKVSPDGQFWYVVSTGGNSLQKYRTSDDSFVGEAIIGLKNWNTLTISNDGNTAYAVDWSAIGDIAQVNTNTFSVTHNIGFSSPHGSCLNPAGDTLYITEQSSSNKIYKIPTSDFSSFTEANLFTTTPPSFLNKLIEKSQINTIFNDKIEIFKLDSNDDTFDAIVDNSSQIFIKRGFCRSLYIANDNANLNEKQEKVIDHILDKCDRKFGGKLGVRNF